ncbi:MAG: GNAT family N-acetyltransferase [Clostridia bacterium]|nr:GNAT family N-acetyltransferase [Clostridia bacterium]
MNYAPRSITLKNGLTAAVQSPSALHAKQMIAYMKAMSAETECVGRYPEEIIETPEYEAELLDNTLSSPNSVQISVFIDGIIAANATITPYSGRIKFRHRAVFGIAVLQKYWGLGLGRMLTEACIQCARDMGYAQIELTALEDNVKGISLYKSVGFKQWGRLEGGSHLKDGSIKTEVYMVKYL